MKAEVFLNHIYNNNLEMSRNVPNKSQVNDFINQLTNLLFPVCNNFDMNPEEMFAYWNKLKIDFKKLLIPLKSFYSNSEDEITELYFAEITSVYSELLLDAKSILEFDPAAHSIEEVVLAYPGFYAIMIYRLSHPLYKLKIPIIPRLFSEHAHSITGIDINPGAKIGNSFFIDHGTGIVIGETTVIGNNVKIYQGVTLGALNVRKEDAKTKRHPSIEDNVIIYSGATILGGNTIVGHDSIIGGNVWLTSSIDPYSVVYHKSEVHFRNWAKREKELIDFTI
ncbi:MAG: serine acetyltransferase [Bacteroidetes bacterium GWF2_33_16]|nr:MAG: serine acetyltransferase [Bacteroidetes bacterium GWE2_32_14]OFY04112.1 MAG: serine acetyltransferase [Bacteroidetes bacterium GWF2_33_16]